MEKKYEVGTKLIMKNSLHGECEITEIVSAGDEHGETVMYRTSWANQLKNAEELDREYYIKL